jgi:DNA modification methylase
MTPRNTILVGDAREELAKLPAQSIDCVITSPPYFQLRDYGAAGQLGAEPTIHGWVAALRAVMREVARLLVPTGGLWINLGDSFSRHPRYGAPNKGLMLAPERLLLALAQDGWITRNKVIWAKSNPLPSSVTDRLNLTYEVVYFLVRSPRYYFDLDAIREPHKTAASPHHDRPLERRPAWAGELAAARGGLRSGAGRHPRGKNPGDVWTIATRGYTGAHFATFPPDLIRKPIAATCPPSVCTRCNRPSADEAYRCKAPTRPGLVLDPFCGTNTVGLVARELGRDWLGVEINPDYVKLAEQRLGLGKDAPAESDHPPPQESEAQAA